MEINWKLSIDEANYILQVLGHRPFDEVAALIANLQEQARARVDEQSEGEDASS